LDRHGCGGQRWLFTSAVLRAQELNLSDPDCCVYEYAPDISNAALAGVGTEDGGTGDRFIKVPECEGVQERDRTLIAAVDKVSESVGDTVVLLSDDEDLLDCVKHLVETDVINVFPMASVDLLVQMLDCGALDAVEFEHVAQIESDHYATYD